MFSGCALLERSFGTALGLQKNYTDFFERVERTSRWLLFTRHGARKAVGLAWVIDWKDVGAWGSWVWATGRVCIAYGEVGGREYT